jgi:short-subunit dehydrogenase
VVTGASSGIGAELGRELVRRNHHVTLVARRRDRLEALAEELGDAAVEVADLAVEAEREALIGRLEHEVVGLCNNAGHGNHGSLDAIDVAYEQNMIRLNCEALHHLMCAFLPRMVEQGSGAILNVASLAAFQPLPGMATYAASKAFVLSLSEAAHAELAGTGVSVTALCPGPVHTEFGDKAGVAHLEQFSPELAYVSAEKVAKDAIGAMAAGRRTVTPTLKWKASAIGGRLVPRTLLLPAVKRSTLSRP